MKIFASLLATRVPLSKKKKKINYKFWNNQSKKALKWKQYLEDKKPHDTQDSQFHCEENSTVLK